MTTPLFFLALAIVLSIVGSVVIALRHRRPDTLHGSVDEFAERMKALAPNSDEKTGT